MVTNGIITMNNIIKIVETRTKCPVLYHCIAQLLWFNDKLILVQCFETTVDSQQQISVYYKNPILYIIVFRHHRS